MQYALVWKQTWVSMKCEMWLHDSILSCLICKNIESIYCTFKLCWINARCFSFISWFYLIKKIKHILSSLFCRWGNRAQYKGYTTCVIQYFIIAPSHKHYSWSLNSSGLTPWTLELGLISDKDHFGPEGYHKILFSLLMVVVKVDATFQG